jgi:hypothetical protein
MHEIDWAAVEREAQETHDASWVQTPGERVASAIVAALQELERQKTQPAKAASE